MKESDRQMIPTTLFLHSMVTREIPAIREVADFRATTRTMAMARRTVAVGEAIEEGGEEGGGTAWEVLAGGGVEASMKGGGVGGDEWGVTGARAVRGWVL